DISPSLLKLLLRAGLAENEDGRPQPRAGGRRGAGRRETWAVLATHPSTPLLQRLRPHRVHGWTPTVALASDAPERPTLGGPL
ncbi:hypothetical protein ACLESO_60150, partial [Pyxidicoccus sp. 3LG]